MLIFSKSVSTADVSFNTKQVVTGDRRGVIHRRNALLHLGDFGIVKTNQSKTHLFYHTHTNYRLLVGAFVKKATPASTAKASTIPAALTHAKMVPFVAKSTATTTNALVQQVRTIHKHTYYLS